MKRVLISTQQRLDSAENRHTSQKYCTIVDKYKS